LKEIELNGISDAQVIQVTKELLESAGVSESCRPINSREDALLALFAICKAAEKFDINSVFREQLEADIEADKEYLAARVTA
jgi:hypothetical protein